MHKSTKGRAGSCQFLYAFLLSLSSALSSVPAMSVSLPLVRTVVLGEISPILPRWVANLTGLSSGTTNLFALIVLALSAFTLSQTVVYLGIYFTYSSLGVATAVIHLASVIAM